MTQTVLKACAGMDDWEFTQFLCITATARLNKLKECLSHKSTLLDWFNDLNALIFQLLAKPPKELTFLMTAEEFMNVQTFDGIESTIESQVGPVCGPLADAHLGNLVGLLPTPLQDSVVEVKGLEIYSTVELISIVFRVYELCVVNSLLSSVFNR